MKAYIFGNIKYLFRIVLILILVAFLAIFTYSFFIPDQVFYGQMYINPIYFYFEFMPVYIYILMYFTILSAISGFIFLISSIYYIKHKEKSELREYKLQRIFSEKLINYLYLDYFETGENHEQYIRYFRKNVRGNLAKGVFFNAIARSQYLLSEDFRKKLFELLRQTDLLKVIEYYLYSHNTANRIIALKVISFMGISNYDKRIMKYTRSSNFALRNEAMLAWVRLSETNNLEFLFGQKKHLSTLAINSMLNAIDRNLKADNIDYDKLINDPSSRVNVAGAMLLRGKSNPRQKEIIKSALDVDDDILREVAWETYTSSQHTPADVEYLINRFPTESSENKQNILRAIQSVEMSSNILSFIDQVILKESILLKIIALKMLFDHNLALFFNYQKMDDARIALACSEVTDFNIS